jgi:uncharacterized protein (DUF983 family)
MIPSLNCVKHDPNCGQGNLKIYFTSVPYGFEVRCEVCGHSRYYSNERQVAEALGISVAEVLSSAVSRELPAGI